MTSSHAFNLRQYLMLDWSAVNAGAGVNCWGLVRKFYKLEFGVTLPEFAINADDIRSIIKASENSDELRNWRRVDNFEFGDVAQLTQSTKPSHYAIYINNDKWLHAQPGFSPVTATVEQLRDAGYRILHVWRRNNG